jgi:hypothetical protein
MYNATTPTKFGFESADESEDPLDLTKMNVLDLLSLREQITSLLPVSNLKDMDLNQELLLQYQAAKSMQSQALADARVDPSKMSTLLNACASSLAALAKLQGEVYNQERLKQIESHLIDTLKQMPKEQVALFFELYEDVHEDS